MFLQKTSTSRVGETHEANKRHRKWPVHERRVIPGGRGPTTATWQQGLARSREEACGAVGLGVGTGVFRAEQNHEQSTEMGRSWGGWGWGSRVMRTVLEWKDHEVGGGQTQKDLKYHVEELGLLSSRL